MVSGHVTVGLVTLLCIIVSALPPNTGRGPNDRETSAVGNHMGEIRAAGIDMVSGQVGVRERRAAAIDMRIDTS